MKGTCRPKKCSHRCQDHVFSMRPINNEASLRSDIQLQFCPKHQNNTVENTYPEFNNDGKSYSHAFILGIDRKATIENDKEMQQDHNRRILEYTEPRKEIFFPKPSRKHKMCSVCRCGYQDYLEVLRELTQHIRSKAHKRQIGNSKYNAEIINLCWTLFNNDNKVEIVLDQTELPSTNNDSRRPSTLQNLQAQPTKRRRYEQATIRPINLVPEVPVLPMLWDHQQLMQQIHSLHRQQQQMFNQFYQAQHFTMMYQPMLNPFVPLPQMHIGAYFQTGVATNPIILDQ